MGVSPDGLEGFNLLSSELGYKGSTQLICLRALKVLALAARNHFYSKQQTSVRWVSDGRSSLTEPSCNTKVTGSVPETDSTCTLCKTPAAHFGRVMTKCVCVSRHVCAQSNVCLSVMLCIRNVYVRRHPCIYTHRCVSLCVCRLLCVTGEWTSPVQLQSRCGSLWGKPVLTNQRSTQL